MSKIIYLNNASTTRIDKEVLNDFIWASEHYWANPSDISSDGVKAKAAIYHAQEQIASYIGAKPSEIVFTSGGCESNNWAIKGYLDRYPGNRTIITTEIEHPSVYNTCKYMETKGYRVEYVPVNYNGEVTSRALDELIERNGIPYSFVSIMMANNEIGTINNIAEISEVVHLYGGVLHVDAVQAFGQIPIDVKKMRIDMMTVSFHKFGGFKNCGFLYIREGLELTPLIHGGHQFDGRRAGTENVPMIYAMGNQVERIGKKDYPKAKLIVRLLYNIFEMCYHMNIIVKKNGAINGLPNNLSLTFKGINAEALITLLDMKNVAVSAGSACCAGSPEPSRVLKAIGLSDEDAFSTIRISIGKDTTREECDEFVRILGECLESLKMVGGE